MKPKAKSVIISLLAVFMVGISWWLASPEKVMPTVKEIRGSAPAMPGATAPSLPQVALEAAVVQPFAHTPFLGVNDPRWKEYDAKYKIDPSSEWRTPIEFFGKVIDELGHPVAGAEIKFEWVGVGDINGGDGVGHRTMTSDVSGLFVINGIMGKRLVMDVRKIGYYSRRSWNDGAFEYGGFWHKEFIEPDRNKPVIFHLVKRPVAEPTYHVDFRSLPKPTAWETRIDFLAQPAETVVGGDIILKINRPTHPGYQNLFDWQLRIEGVNGAEIIMSEEEFMLLAPGQGYQKIITKEYKGVRGNSIEMVKFYVRNKARKLYAAVSVEITPYYPNHATREDTACFIVSGTVNPNDSPNVEYDPKKDIREMAKK